MILADAAVLGIFEDAGQRDFHRGLLENISNRQDLDIILEPRLTDGCRFDFLSDHLELAEYFDGVLIGIDGKRRSPAEKIDFMERKLKEREVDLQNTEVLWAVAIPSIEEWITGDAVALPEAIRIKDRLVDRPVARRPGGANSERTAKARLRDWARRLSGADPLNRGLEYAEEVGRQLEPSRVGTSRNPDLREFAGTSLPHFLRQIA